LPTTDTVSDPLPTGPGLAHEDDHARERAVDPQGSFIVQAPAGSGKTGLLVLRLLRLLGLVARPESILAITFTRKAQAEMRHRVIQALTEAATGCPLPEAAPPFERERRRLALAALDRSRELGWDLIAQPERIGILTIDALNSRLVRRLPITSGLGVTPQPCEDASHLYAEAVATVLTCLEEGPEPIAAAIEQVLGHLDNDRPRLARLLLQMLGSRDRWQRHLDVLHDPESLHVALAEEVALRLAQLRARLPDGFLAPVAHFGRWAQANLSPTDGLATVLAPFKSMQVLPGCELADVPCWCAIATLLLTNDGEPRRKLDKRQGFPADGPQAKPAEYKAEKAAAQAFIQATFRDDPELAVLLHAARKLPAAGYTASEAKALVALGTLLEASLRALAVTSVARGELDFSALAAGALAALGPEDAPTDLGLALDARIEHILLDEFQDTSPAQVELLTRLVAGWQAGDGRTLFLVGDPMQSIYGFREAEVGLFLKVWQQARIGSVALQRLVLRRNFRSRAAIVEWVNTCFSHLMPAAGEPVAGRIAYSASLAAAADRDAAACVRVHTPADRAAEAAGVVQLVRELRTTRPGASVALLGRTRNHLLPALVALAQAGLPVQGVGLETLGARPVVRDLLALARALAHPGDRLAWLACLRAPWCGLDLASLTHLADPTGPGLLMQRIFDAAVLSGLAAPMRTRLTACLPAFEEALAGRATVPLALRVARCWVALGGPLCLTDEAERRTAWQCLHLMARHGDADLEALETALGSAPIDTPPGADAGLQAMTMHKAKGLEFDVVLLVGLGGKGRPRERSLLAVQPRLRSDGPDGLLIAPIAARQQQTNADSPIEAFIHALGVEAERAEDLRLLYVAATRARHELHLFGSAVWREPKSEDAGWSPVKNTLLWHLWPIIGSPWGPLPGPTAPPTSTEPTVATVAQPSLRRLPPGWAWPELPQDVAATEGSGDGLRPVNPEAPPAYEWAGRSARAIGTTVHAALQVIAGDGLAAWDGARVTASRGRWRAQLAATGLTGPELDAATVRVTRAIEGALDDPRGRWCLSPHQAAESEWALCGMSDGELVHRVIDRFLVVDDQIWIIDFKTSSHDGGAEEAFLDNEVERYRPQLEGYARLIAAMDARPIHLGLYFPLLRGWRSWRALASAG